MMSVELLEREASNESAASLTTKAIPQGSVSAMPLSFVLLESWAR